MGRDSQPQHTDTERNWVLGDFISSGQTWKVYEDPTDDHRVIKVSVEPNQEAGFRHGELIALMLHLIFPENIPKIFEVGQRLDGRRQLRVTKVFFHPTYQRMTQLRNKPFVSDEEATERSDLLRAHADWVSKSNQSQTLLLSLQAMGIGFDDLTVTNIVRDAENKAVYVDDLNIGFSWKDVKATLKKHVDRTKQEELDRLIKEYEALPPEEDEMWEY